ncbi:hypothetical protein SAMN05444166_0306 [Singulisphaera sp. GP187]|uniref:hypothetical protein n=1 Tax=Singulisphaera sp. GP187 TaxID=1882752 RepID=UPI0009269558|nr:hypothetical protein [Singulisphaera sp. GP187]SIN70929.1 hypothetical protein SAMN05444166_0306 [Singulisphaera sp. GP187]
MPEPLLPLYEAYTASASDLIAAQAKHDAAKAALFAAMPDGVEFATTADHPPVIKRVGDQIETVTMPFLGHPYPHPND